MLSSKKKLTCKEIFAASVNLLEAQNAIPPPPYTLYSVYVYTLYTILEAGSLKMITALEYSTRVVQEGGRRCKKSTLNDLVHLTPLRIPLMNPLLFAQGIGGEFNQRACLRGNSSQSWVENSQYKLCLPQSSFTCQFF
jgi:hypothetical protein